MYTKQQEYEIIHGGGLTHIRFLMNEIRLRTPHFHQEIELNLVLRGTGETVIGGQAYSLAPGGLVITDTNVPHEILGKDGGVLLLIVQISKAIAREIFPGLHTVRLPSGAIAADLPPAAAEALRREIAESARLYFARPWGYALPCTAGALNILYLLLRHLPVQQLSQRQYRAEAQREARLGRILDFLAGHYTQRLTLGDAAAAEGLSPTYFSHFFRENVGLTFQEYLNRLRFSHVLDRLGTSPLTLTELCLDAGFADTRYFSRTYQARFGALPRPGMEAPGAAAAPPPQGTRQRLFSPEESLRLLAQYCPSAPG